MIGVIPAETGVYNRKQYGIAAFSGTTKMPITYFLETRLDRKGYSCCDAKTKKQVGTTPN
jgi:hypothetical protein